MRLCNIYNEGINKNKKECVPPARAPIALEGRILHVFEGHPVPTKSYVFIYCIYLCFIRYLYI